MCRRHIFRFQNLTPSPLAGEGWGGGSRRSLRSSCLRSSAALERIRAEQTRLDAARAVDSAEQGFRGPFAWPAAGPISGVYGSQRILNGEPRAPHVGLDIAGPEGAPVRAPAAGVVRLADPDLFFTGGTVILD